MAYRYRRGRRYRRGHGMPTWRKVLKAAVNGSFKVFGIAAAAAPAAPAIQHAIELGRIDQLGIDVLYNYTGVNPVSKTIDWGQTLVGAGSVAGGLFLFWVGGKIARHV